MDESTTRMPATNPTRIAVPGVRTSAPAVTPTSPAKIPFSTIPKSRRLDVMYDVNSAPIAPAQAPKQVITRTKDTSAASAERTEPPLNPNQPNQSRKAPITANGTLTAGLLTV